MALGIATAIYRSGDPNDPGDSTPHVEATIPGTGSDIPCKFYGEPPPPLTWCEFTDVGGGEWFCEGPREYDVRRVVHEDFTIVPTVTVTGTAACDTPWTVTINGAGSQVSAFAGSQLGVALLLAGAANARYAQVSKDDLAIAPAAADAFWMTVRMAIGSVGSTNIYFGLQNAAGTDGCRVGYFSGSSANWTLSTMKDSSFGAASSALTAAVDGYHDIDMLLVPGVSAHAWFDGDGPYSVTDTTRIPTTGDSITPFVQCQSLTAASKSLVVDYVTLTAISGDVVNPETDPAFA